MFQSIKVDMIYFATASDFEMEFNLGGCCRMRLLTDKAADRKTFIRSLSRAVSRSRVIICCGPLFGESGLIAGVAAAIGQPLKTANASAFGILGEPEIQIIDGSIPLVTDDGVFGGCVVESGPQSIILLTESKSVRKSIMNTLIHPYIVALSQKEVSEKLSEKSFPNQKAPDIEMPIPPVETPIPAEIVLPDAPEEKPVSTETDVEEISFEEPVEDPAIPEVCETTSSIEEENACETPTHEEVITQEISEPDLNKKAETAEATNETEAIEEPESVETESTPAEEMAENDMPAEELNETDPEAKPDIELFFDAEDVVFNKKKYYDMYYETENQLIGITEDYYLPKNKGHRALNILSLIFMIVLFLCLAFLAYSLLYLPLRDGTPITTHFKEIFSVVNFIHPLRPF